jgi:secondary thiamine-phosphate synthase enzyme
MEITVQTSNKSALVDVTQEIQKLVSAKKVADGMCFLFLPHTTAGLIINENHDPELQKDILEQLLARVPQDKKFRHSGGNAFSHIQAAMTAGSLSIPIEKGRLDLGAWQGIFLVEFDGPKTRKIKVKIQIL